MRTSSKLRSSPYFGKMCFVKFWPFLEGADQGLVKGEKLCCRNPYFYFRHGESTSTASQLTSPASQESKDLNKVSLLLQDLGYELMLKPKVSLHIFTWKNQWQLCLFWVECIEEAF